jgi:hypothetical protein
MATDSEKVILEFEVQQGSAITELEKTKKSIIGLKEEQNALNKAYKAGDVTLEEYASESVRLEGILKKQQSSYNNVQKSVTGVKTQMDKLIDSNKKISSEFANTASQIRIAGVSMDEVKQKASLLTGPGGVLVGAVAVVGALGAAYARSTIGAKDLEFASNQLSFATTILTNKFAALISSSEDGEGLLTDVTNDALQAFEDITKFFSGDTSGTRKGGITEVTKQLALNAERLEDLTRDEIQARAEVNERLGDNQELLTKIQDSQTEYNEKIYLTDVIQTNLNKNSDQLTKIKEEQLAIAKENLKIDPVNEQNQTIVLNIQREISAIEKDRDRRLSAIQRLQSNITDQYQKQLQAQKDLAAQQEEERRKTSRQGVTERGAGGSSISDLANDTVKLDAKLAAQQVSMAEQTEEQKQELARQTYEYRKALAEEELMLTAAMLGQASALFGEQSIIGKTIAIANATINTYQGATLALATLPPPFSFIGAALTIATGLASVAKIGGVDIAAAGGADFVTSKPTMLLVGDNPGGRERVTVEPLSGKGKTRAFSPNGIAMAGGGSLTVDGGAAKNAATSEINQSIAFANAIKNMPQPVVGVKEITRVQKRVSIKENLARA